MIRILISNIGPNLLATIAEYADLETMEILNSAHAVKISYELTENSVARCREYLTRRRDYDEKLGDAFEDLIQIALNERREDRSTDSDLESGLYIPAKYSFHSELAEAVADLNAATLDHISKGSSDGKSSVDGPEDGD